jgi:hypothetical protein
LPLDELEELDELELLLLDLEVKSYSKEALKVSVA